MPLARSRREPRPSVLLVAAGDSMCCARIPAVLARGGWHVTVLAPAENPALSSRHTARRLPVRSRGSSAVRRLRSLLESGAARFDWIILGDEEIVAAVASRRQEPWAASCLPVAPERDAVELVTEKTSFIAACQRHGIPTPRSRVCRAAAEALTAAEEIGFPLLLKANFGASGTTVWPVGTAVELMQELPRAAGQPFTLQQRLEGEAGVTEMLCSQGRVIAIVSSVMRGIDPEPFGPASSRVYRRNLAAEEVGARLAAVTRFHGFCGFDWMQTGGPAGPVHVLEFHARPTLGFHMARHAGVDFARATRRLEDRDFGTPVVQSSNDEVTCLLFPKDLTRAWRRRDFGGLLRWLPGGSHNDLPWNDLPFAWRLARRFVVRRATRAPEYETASPHTESPSVLTGF